MVVCNTGNRRGVSPETRGTWDSLGVLCLASTQHGLVEDEHEHRFSKGVRGMDEWFQIVSGAIRKWFS